MWFQRVRGNFPFKSKSTVQKKIIFKFCGKPQLYLNTQIDLFNIEPSSEKEFGT